jgi:hypothetical protein
MVGLKTWTAAANDELVGRSLVDNPLPRAQPPDWFSLRSAGDDQVGDRDDQVGDSIGDKPRLIRSDPFQDEQFALSARAHYRPNELSPI